MGVKLALSPYKHNCLLTQVGYRGVDGMARRVSFAKFCIMLTSYCAVVITRRDVGLALVRDFVIPFESNDVPIVVLTYLNALSAAIMVIMISIAWNWRRSSQERWSSSLFRVGSRGTAAYISAMVLLG